MMRGTKSIRELLKSRFGFKEQLRKRKVQLQPPEKGDPVEPRKKVKKALPPPPAAESQDSMEEYTPSQAPEPEAPQEGPRPMLPAPSSAPAEPPTEAPRAEDVPVPPMDENEWLEEYRHLPQEERRRILQDDVPHGIKRKGGITEEDADRAVKRLRSNFCAATAASTVYGTLQNEWVSRYEVELLRQLTGLPVTAARIHRAPRKRLQRPPKMVSRSRLSILIGKDPASTFIVNEKDAEVAAHPRRRASFEWRGLTMFYRTEDPSKPTEVFVELPDGIHGVTLTTSEAAEFQQMWLEEMHDTLLAEVMILRMKQSGKELDPSFFDAFERQAFNKSDIKEWSEWIKNKVVRRVEKGEYVPPSCIFRAPLRMLRVNKAASPLLPLVAKSRLIVPGHLDPHLGEFRTDSPTCPQAAVRAAKAIAAARGWGGVTFDVTTAFLSGKETSRKLYIRAPREGLPPAMGWPPIKSGELLAILKSAYGLTESPRLWYLEAVDRLKGTPLKELAVSRSTFVAGGSRSERCLEDSWAILCLHVDDGLLLGDLSDPRVIALRKQIDNLFTIKEWKEVTAEKPIQFLGVEITRDSSGFHDDMSRYIKEIKVEKLQGEGLLGPREVTLYRQLVMRLRWPAQQTMPHMLYEVSNLAQRLTKATHADYKEAVKLHQKFVEEANAGRARLTYPPLDKNNKWFYVSYFDASLGKESDGKSQLGAVHFLTTAAARTGPAAAAPVEFSTNKSSRVLRSSMSAEACSMSICVDRHLYGRLVIDMMLYGYKTLDENWRTTMGISGGVVTDAKSLYDHMGTTGQIPTERQTMLDLMVARDHLESGAYELFSVPTHRQHADGLTKKMKNILWETFCKLPRISLKETEDERKLEEHRKGLRKAQRQRRKDRMKGREPSQAAPAHVQYVQLQSCQHTLLAM